MPSNRVNGFQSSLTKPNIVLGAITPTTSTPIASASSSSISPSIWYGSTIFTRKLSLPNSTLCSFETTEA